MKTFRSPVLNRSAIVLGFCLGLTGCAQAASESPQAAAVQVAVSYPLEQDVTDYAEFTARTAAVDSVEVGRIPGDTWRRSTSRRGRWWKGDVLFELDPRPYEAMLNQAEGQGRPGRSATGVRRGRITANLELVAVRAVSNPTWRRMRQPAASISPTGGRQAMVASRQLDLEYTKIKAPVSGRVSRYLVTVGNLIQSGDQANVTLLTTIVSVDPMYAYFDVDEHTVLRVRQLLRQGKAELGRAGLATSGLPVALGLANEEGFPHQGTINFVDNQVNPKTGTLRLRGTFPNKDESLSPGFFAASACPSARPTGPSWCATAPDTDQGQKFVYVVNDKNEVVSRPVRAGACTTACGRSGRPEAGRAGDRQRPATGPVGDHRRAASRGNAKTNPKSESETRDKLQISKSE